MKRSAVFFSSGGGLAVLGALAVLVAGAGGRNAAPDSRSEEGSFALNALDYRMNLYDLRRGRPGSSRHIDENYREYVGDLYFTGTDFTVLETDRYTGHFVDLGEEKKPDGEFALFHALRIYKRTFQLRGFPFLERYLPHPAIDATAFFGRVREPRTSVKVGLGHVYLLRLFHRTTVGDERVFLMKIMDYTPGLKVEAIWRELEVRSEGG